MNILFELVYLFYFGDHCLKHMIIYTYFYKSPTIWLSIMPCRKTLYFTKN